MIAQCRTSPVVPDGELLKAEFPPGRPCRNSRSNSGSSSGSFSERYRDGGRPLLPVFISTSPSSSQSSSGLASPTHERLDAQGASNRWTDASSPSRVAAQLLSQLEERSRELADTKQEVKQLAAELNRSQRDLCRISQSNSILKEEVRLACAGSPDFTTQPRRSSRAIRRTSGVL